MDHINDASVYSNYFSLYPDAIRVTFSTLINMPDEEGKYHIISSPHGMVVPEAIEYKFIFDIMGVTDESVEMCIRSAQRKLNDWIQGRDNITFTRKNKVGL